MTQPHRLLGGLILGVTAALAITACAADGVSPVSAKSPVARPAPPPPLQWPPTAPLDPEIRATWEAGRAAENGTERSTTGSDTPSDHCDDPGYWNSRDYGDPSDYVEACGEWPSWVPEIGETESSAQDSGRQPPHQYTPYSCDIGEDGTPICEGDVPESVGEYDTPSEASR